MAIHESSKIHPSCEIDNNVKIGKNCVIGPFCSISSGSELEDNIELFSHVSIAGSTFIGTGTKIWPHASIGHQPQDLKFSGEATDLIIGRDNKIREGVSINPGTKGGGGITKIGNGCLFMLGSHVGHDCELGNNIIIANNAALAGHVVIGDAVHIGGLSGVHQFVRVGKGAFIGALSMVTKDVIPFGMVHGERATLRGLNLVGLRRASVGSNCIKELKKIYSLLFSSKGTLKQRVSSIDISDDPIVTELLSFINQSSDRALLGPVSETSGNTSS